MTPTYNVSALLTTGTKFQVDIDGEKVPFPTAPYPVNTILPSLTLMPANMAITSAVTGQTLFGNVGLWVNQPTGYAYQFMRNGAVFQAGPWSDPDPSYTVQLSDVGTVITINATAGDCRHNRAWL